MEYFPFVKSVQYKGPTSTEPFAFKYYDANRVVLGKPMKEWLPFAMAWWHNLGAAGTDMFGGNTMDKSWGVDKEKDPMGYAKAKVDAGFEFMQKMGIEYYCFHDVDLVPECDDITVMYQRLDEIGYVPETR